MNELAIKKSKYIQKRYQIDSFPIPLWQIEQAIIDQGFDIVISKSLCKSCVIKKTVYVPYTMDFNSRFMLSHELGHILCHNCDIHRLDPTLTNKYEYQANAFAFYFLMPPKSFEINAKSFNIYELAELYGVPFEAVKNRLKLILEIKN